MLENISLRSVNFVPLVKTYVYLSRYHLFSTRQGTCSSQQQRNIYQKPDIPPVLIFKFLPFYITHNLFLNDDD